MTFTKLSAGVRQFLIDLKIKKIDIPVLSIIFFLGIYILNPSNYVIILFFTILFFLYNMSIRNVRVSLFLIFIISLSIITGKTYSIQLLPQGSVNIDQAPSGIFLWLTISYSHIITYLMVLIVLLDLFKKKTDIRRIYPMDIAVICYFFSILISNLLYSDMPEISSIETFFLSSIPISYFYLKIYQKYIFAYKNVIFLLICSVVISQSVISGMQYINKSPLGKTIEYEKNLQTVGDTAEQSPFSFRPLGTFGHANQLATYLAFCLPIALALLLQKKTFLTITGVCFGTFAILLSLSRSSWLGLTAALVFFIYTVYIYNHRFRRSLLFFWNHLLFTWQTTVVTLIMLIISTFYMAPRLEQSLYTFNTTEGGLYIRLEQIKNSIQLIQMHPLFGVGSDMNIIKGLEIDPNGVMYIFPSVVHNWFLFVTVENGIITLLILLSIFTILFVRSEKDITQKKKDNQNLLRIGVLSGIISCTVMGLFQPYMPLTLIILYGSLVQERI